MALTRVNVGAASAVTTGTTPGYPASLAANDLLIMYVSSDSVNVPTSQSTWTQLGSLTTGGGVTQVVWYKIATGSETGTHTITGVTGGTKGVSWIIAYRGATQARAVGVTFGPDTNSSNTTISSTGSSLTTRTGDVLDLHVAYIAASGTFSAANSSPVVTQSGATLTSTARLGARTGTNTVVYGGLDGAVTSGGTGAPNYAATSVGANGAGQAIFVHIHESVTYGIASGGTGTSTGTLAVTALLKASAAATGTSSGALSAHVLLKASAAATGTSSGTLAATILPGGTTHTISASATSTSSGTLAAGTLLKASASASGSAGGSLAAGTLLKASGAATGAVSGTLAAGLLLKASASATGTSSGTLSASLENGPITWPISGSATGTSSGGLATTMAYAVKGSATSTSSGGLAARVIMRIAASATSTSSGSATASLQIALQLAGSGTSGGSASVSLLLKASASALASSGGTMAATVRQALGVNLTATMPPDDTLTSAFVTIQGLEASFASDTS